MASMNLSDLCDGIETALSAVSGLHTQSYDELTEGIQNTPLLQVYPVRGALRAETGQHTFRGVVRINDITIHADVYAKTRVNIGTDMAAVVDLHDDITDVLDLQKTGSPFSVTGVKAFTYSWDYAPFEYAGVGYVGIRYVMEFITY